jgi:hypothetical protein
MHRKGVQLKSSMLKSDRALHSHPATCVIAQQYSSATFAFIPITKNKTRFSKTFLQWFYFSGAFAKWRKATRSFVVSVCLPVCLSLSPYVRMEQLGTHRTDWHEISYLSIFRKSVEKIQLSAQSDKNNECFK